MKLRDVLDSCQKTGAWYGMKIESLDCKNDMDDTPLHTVCSWSDPLSTKVLIQAGADINAKGDLGGTPLFNAIIGDSPEVVQILLEAGADKNIVNDDGRLPLEYAKNVSANPKIIQLLR